MVNEMYLVSKREKLKALSTFTNIGLQPNFQIHGKYIYLLKSPKGNRINNFKPE